MPQTKSPWLHDIFPDCDGPYTVARIIERLQQYHTSTISRSSVYRALGSLRRSRATASLVRPENEGDDVRARDYSASAARRIAQRVTRDRPPQNRNAVPEMAEKSA